MPKRSALAWIPLLVLLVLAWGTCPCFYAQLLSGGLLGSEVECQGACDCSATVASSFACEDRGAPPDVAPVPPSGDCPCIGTIGTMHELPQPEAPSDLIPPAPCIAHAPEHALPIESRGDLAELAAACAEPGPEHRSVVLLV